MSEARKRREIGILFKTVMVQALRRPPTDPLHKTVTRRVSKVWRNVQPGDLLWVREPWSIDQYDALDTDVDQHGVVAGGSEPRWAYQATWEGGEPARKWRPAIHMPRAACRMHLEVVSVTPEPMDGPAGRMLPCVTEDEARREGCASREEFVKLFLAIQLARGRLAFELFRIEFREVWRG
jgi:hypothetical protein